VTTAVSVSRLVLLTSTWALLKFTTGSSKTTLKLIGVSLWSCPRLADRGRGRRKVVVELRDAEPPQ